MVLSLKLDILETERLIIRPFAPDDLDDIHRILNEAFGTVDYADRREWLAWAVLNPTALERLRQPPYGDRAVVLKASNTLIGSVGLVPSCGPFDKLPYFRARSVTPPSGLFTPEMGMFWALGANHRGQGYVTEAARALIAVVFDELGWKRVVAMTEYGNAASVAVMKRLGMTIERNPDPTPEWFQIVGVLENPKAQL
jgi:ribosomal-protein-alanine N-acetyltransferase